MQHPQHQFWGVNETILRTCYVQISKIDAYSVLSILFLYYRHICKPAKIMCIPDYVIRLQPIHFFIHGLILLACELHSLLLDWLNDWVYIQHVPYNLWDYSRHITCIPHEAIYDLLQKINELITSLECQASSNLHCPI